MAGFRATSGGVSARFAKPEAAVIRDLVQQVIELVGPAVPAFAADELDAIVGMPGPEQDAPGDPALARLLPDAYRDDPEAAREFRRFTEPGLRSAKVAAARTLLATLPPEGGRVRLTRDEAEAWLRSLNDVRLALGVRLGITSEDDDLYGRVPRDDPRRIHVDVYHWLSYLQDSLVTALS